MIDNVDDEWAQNRLPFEGACLITNEGEGLRVLDIIVKGSGSTALLVGDDDEEESE